MRDALDAEGIWEAIRDAGLTKEQIDRVLLVGGSTRMPAVSDLVRELTGKEGDLSARPGPRANCPWVVQRGARR